MDYIEPIFKLGDESRFEISNKMVMDYLIRFTLKPDDSDITRLLKQAYLKQARKGILFELVKEAWIQDAKDRNLWRPDPFPEIDYKNPIFSDSIRELKEQINSIPHQRPPADDVLLNNLASRYTNEDDDHVKKIWFDYKERWLHRKIQPSESSIEWNKTLDIIGIYKRNK